MKKKYSLVIADVEMNVVTDAPWESVEKIVGIIDRKMRDINLKSYRCTKNQAALLCALEYCSEKLALQDRNAELEEIAEQDAATIEAKDAKIAELEAELAKLQGENEIMHSILERAAASTKRMMGHQEPETAAAVAAPKTTEEPETIEAPEAVEVVEAVEAVETVVVPEEPEIPELPEQLSVDFEQAEASNEETAKAQSEEASKEQPEEKVEEKVEEKIEEKIEEQPEVNTKAAKVIEEIADSQTDVPRVKAKAKKSNNRSRVGSMFDLLTFNDV